jgi:hypothetical protein
MATLPPPEPIQVTTPAGPLRPNRLAVVSFLLSLIPVLMGALFVVTVIVAMIAGPISPLSTALHAQQDELLGASILVVTGSGLVCGLGGIVTGIVALRRRPQYAPQQARAGLAIAGLTIGVVLVMIPVCIVASDIAAGMACARIGCY